MTTGTRVILFNQKAGIHSMAYRELRQIYLHPGWVERVLHPPGRSWDGITLDPR